MNPTHAGYVKLWRKTLDSGLLQHPNAWQVFGYCLLRAMWKDKTHPTLHGVISLKPGQFVTGRKVMSQELNTTEDKIRTALKLLTTMEIITIETTSHFSIITLKNWDKYQNDGDTAPNENPKPSPSLPQAFPTEEEGKKVRTTNIEPLKPKTKQPKPLGKRDRDLLLQGYYEVFDPRHPGYRKDAPNTQDQARWEAGTGRPWAPKPKHPEDNR